MKSLKSCISSHVAVKSTGLPSTAVSLTVVLTSLAPVRRKSAHKPSLTPQPYPPKHTHAALIPRKPSRSELNAPWTLALVRFAANVVFLRAREMVMMPFPASVSHYHFYYGWSLCMEPHHTDRAQRTSGLIDTTAHTGTLRKAWSECMTDQRKCQPSLTGRALSRSIEANVWISIPTGGVQNEKRWKRQKTLRRATHSNLT